MTNREAWGIAMFMAIILLYGLATTVYIANISADMDHTEEVMLDNQESVFNIESTSSPFRGTSFAVTGGKTGKQYMLTNAHVCESSPKGEFSVSRKTSFKDLDYVGFTKIIEISALHDLCLLTMPKNVEARSLPLAKAFYPDERVYTMGFPIINRLVPSSGHIRGVVGIQEPYPVKSMDKCLPPKLKKIKIKKRLSDREIEEEICITNIEGIYSDTVVDGGASGSPVLNESGEVVGVVMMSLGNMSRTLSVPLPYLKQILSKY